MNRRRRNLIIIVVAALAILGIILFVLLSIHPFAGGTPIIIKGFGDPGPITIDGAADSTAAKVNQKKSHRRRERIDNFYVLDKQGRCVIYNAGKSGFPNIEVTVKNAGDEIEIKRAWIVFLDVLFDDDSTYEKYGDNKYRRRMPGSIESVKVNPGSGTTCSFQGFPSPPISNDCPDLFTSPDFDLTTVTIGLNYTTGNECKPSWSAAQH